MRKFLTTVVSNPHTKKQLHWYEIDKETHDQFGETRPFENGLDSFIKHVSPDESYHKQFRNGETKYFHVTPEKLH